MNNFFICKQYYSNHTNHNLQVREVKSGIISSFFLFGPLVFSRLEVALAHLFSAILFENFNTIKIAHAHKS